MSKLVSVQQAAANALADYLSSVLNNPKVYPNPVWKAPVSVEPRWPDPKRLPARSVTIVTAGPRTNGSDPVLGWWHNAEKVNPQPPGLPPGMIMWRWTVGWYKQPIQMDVWTLSDIDRDDLVARLDVALHSGPGELSPDQPGGHDPIVDYLVIPLRQKDGWPGARADVYFDEDGPTLDDTPTNAEQSIYRATWRGTIEMILTVDAPEPAIARIQLDQWLGESVDETFTTPADLSATYDSTGAPILVKPGASFGFTGALGTRASQLGNIELGAP